MSGGSHHAAGGAQDRARAGVERPREARPRPEVVFVHLEVVGERVAGERARVRDAEELVADPEQHLEAVAHAQIVLDEEGQESRVVGDLGVADELGERRVAARSHAAPGRQVRVHGGECVELEQVFAAEVVHVLDVEAGLEAVTAAQDREVVEHLPDLLAEVEAGVGDGRDGTAEEGDAADGVGGARARAVAGRARLVAARVLEEQLVELVRPEGGDELRGDGVHAVVEVRRLLDRVGRAQETLPMLKGDSFLKKK
jgi:hypothetical protein